MNSILQHVLLKTFILCALAAQTLYAQTSIEIGMGKKIIAYAAFQGTELIAYSTPEPQKGEKAGMYLMQGKLKNGPYEHIYIAAVSSPESADEEYGTPAQEYMVAQEKGKQYLFLGSYRFGPYDQAEIVKLTAERVVIVNRRAGKNYYEIHRITGGKSNLEQKSEVYPDQLGDIYVSDEMDVLLVLNDPTKELGGYFIYEGTKVGWFYNTMDFQGWLKTADGLQPVFAAVESIDHEMYEVTNNVYVGTRLIDKVVAVLYDFDFNEAHTDFVFKGFRAERDGARVYTSTKQIGPYERVSHLKIDSLNRVVFDCTADDQDFHYVDGKLTPISKEKKENYLWKKESPYSTDVVTAMEVDDEEMDVFLNGELFARMNQYDLVKSFWTRQHGIVMVDEVVSRTPDGEGMVLNLEATRLWINGKLQGEYEQVLDVQESPEGELFYVVQEKGKEELLVYLGEQRSDPLRRVYAVGREQGQFVAWGNEGKDAYYSAIGEGGSQVYRNGQSERTFPAILRFFFHEDLSTSAFVLIYSAECVLEADFTLITLDNAMYTHGLEEERQLEYESRYDALSQQRRCSAVVFRDVKYGPFGFIQNEQMSANGQAFAFQDFEDWKVIYNDHLYDGYLSGDVVLIYEEGTVQIHHLD